MALQRAGLHPDHVAMARWELLPPFFTLAALRRRLFSVATPMNFHPSVLSTGRRPVLPGLSSGTLRHRRWHDSPRERKINK